MSDAYRQRLSFTVHGLPDDTFTVFRMNGREAISELFRYEIDAVGADCDLPARSVVGKSGRLTISRLGQSRTIFGMIERFELLAGTPQGEYVFKIVLVPRLSKLALTRQNQIHGTTDEVSVREVLADELTAAALEGQPAAAVSGRLGLNDFELRLTQEYPKRDYIVQYDESDFAFISRLCEHYGIFYFFSHESGRDTVIFSDSRVAFATIQGAVGISYRSVSGLANADQPAIYRLTRRDSMVAAKVCLRDYNHRIPNMTLEVYQTADPDGHGVVVDYGSHFRNPDEGRALARVRAQELMCRKTVFEGVGDCVHFAAGTVFDLTDHFCHLVNAGYMLTWVEHEATQATPGIAEFTGPGHETSYRNRFECLPKDIEFRPARVTPKPRMAGLSNAVVDAAGPGRRAEIDRTGRYKIRQQFDQRGAAAGHASRYMRKAEPYGGANTGMHFPLLKGTEVVLACVNGDPDRPIIVGAMQNEQFPSIVNARNRTKNRIRTTSGTLFEIDDGPSADPGDDGDEAEPGLAPQRALAGMGAADAGGGNATQGMQPLATQRAEADITTDAAPGTSPSYARLHVTAGTDSYWRLGGTAVGESGFTPKMSDMTIRSSRGPGAEGLLEYTAGARTSLIADASYTRVDGDSLEYVAGNRRTSAAAHNAVSQGNYGVVAKGVSIEASTGDITANASPAKTPGHGNIELKAAKDLSQTVGGHFWQHIGGDGELHVHGDKTTRTWGSTADYLLGSQVKMVLGISTTVNLALTLSILGGAKVDMLLAAKFEFLLGSDYKLRVGPAWEVVSSAKGDAGTATLRDVVADIKTAVNNLTSSTTEIHQGIARADMRGLSGLFGMYFYG